MEGHWCQPPGAWPAQNGPALPFMAACAAPWARTCSRSIPISMCFPQMPPPWAGRATGPPTAPAWRSGKPSPGRMACARAWWCSRVFSAATTASWRRHWRLRRRCEAFALLARRHPLASWRGCMAWACAGCAGTWWGGTTTRHGATRAGLRCWRRPTRWAGTWSCIPTRAGCLSCRPGCRQCRLRWCWIISASPRPGCRQTRRCWLAPRTGAGRGRSTSS